MCPHHPRPHHHQGHKHLHYSICPHHLYQSPPFTLPTLMRIKRFVIDRVCVSPLHLAIITTQMPFLWFLPPPTKVTLMSHQISRSEKSLTNPTCIKSPQFGWISPHMVSRCNSTQMRSDQKTSKTQKTGILKFYKFLEFYDVLFKQRWKRSCFVKARSSLHKVKLNPCKVTIDLHEVMSHPCDYFPRFLMFNLTSCGLNHTLHKICSFASRVVKIPKKFNEKPA